MAMLRDQDPFSRNTEILIAGSMAGVYDPERRADAEGIKKFLLEQYSVPHDVDGYGVVIPGSVDKRAYYENFAPSLVQDAVNACAAIVTKKYVEISAVRIPLADIAPVIGDRIAATKERAARMAGLIIGSIPAQLPATQKAVLAGDEMAYLSYGDKRRKSGRLYYEHPLTAAAISFHLTEELINENYPISPEEQIAVAVVAEDHDSVEEWLKAPAHYSSDPDVLAVTPLALRYAMQKAGLGSKMAGRIANSLRLLSHEKAAPWMPDYMEYIDRLSPDLYAVTGKIPDIFDNFVVDPKPLPQKKTPNESDDELAERRAGYDYHKAEYDYLLYGGGMLAAGRNFTARSNVFTMHNENWWGMAYYRKAQQLAIPEHLADSPKYRHRGIPTRTEFVHEVLPGIVGRFIDRFDLPDRTAA